jgi:hypothetical protein
MSKIFRPSTRESSLLSKIETSIERERKQAVHRIRDCIDPLSNAISMKLVETNLVETTSKNTLEEQIQQSLDTLSRANDFDIDYQIAPIRTLVNQPNIVSLYLTAFVIEQLIKHKDIVDIFGSDEDIYRCIHKEVRKFIP